MAVDALTAQVRELRAYLEAGLALQIADAADPVGALVSSIREGWPEAEEEMTYPTLAIDAPGVGERIPHPPILVRLTQPADPADWNLPVLYSVGQLASRLTLTLFCSSRAQRRRCLQAIEIAMQGGVVSGGGIVRRTSASYYGREIGYLRDGPWTLTDTASRVGADEWQAELIVEAESEELVPADLVRLIDLSVAHTAGGEGVTIPVETQTIFKPPTP